MSAQRVFVGLIIAIALGMFAGAVGAMAGSLRAVSHERTRTPLRAQVVDVYLCEKLKIN